MNHSIETLTQLRRELSVIQRRVQVALRTQVVLDEAGVPRDVLAAISVRPETTLCLRHIQLGFMWLGKAKGILGVANPYPDSTNPANRTIEEATDVLILENDPPYPDELVFAKTVRGQLGIIEHAIRHGLISTYQGNVMFQLCVQNAYTFVENAKMYLGLVLGAIRDQEKASEKKPPVDAPAAETPKDLTPTPEMTVSAGEGTNNGADEQKLGEQSSGQFGSTSVDQGDKDTSQQNSADGNQQTETSSTSADQTQPPTTEIPDQPSSTNKEQPVFDVEKIQERIDQLEGKETIQDPDKEKSKSEKPTVSDKIKAKGKNGKK